MRLSVLILLALIAGLAGLGSPAQASTTVQGASASVDSCVGARFVAPALPRAADDAIPIEDDRDCDEVANATDNCADDKNGDQSDIDRDGRGDACDDDIDGDGLTNAYPARNGAPAVPDLDNCDFRPNPGQEDSDGDGVGDACLIDTDGDKVLDHRDNCWRVVNPEQTDTDRDSYGDACDGDDDDDYLLDGGDNCPLVPNPGLADADRDGLGDACDPNTTILSPGPGPGRGTGTGPGTPADRRAPTVGVRAARLQRSTDAVGGMPVLVRCSEACAITARITVSARDARRLKLARSARKPVVVASGTAGLDAAGATYVFFDVARSARRRVFTAKGVAASLEIRVVDGAGNPAVDKRRMQLRR